MDTLVIRLQVGPHNRDQQPWNRQLLMLQKLPTLFPCLREINFDQVRLQMPVLILCLSTFVLTAFTLTIPARLICEEGRWAWAPPSMLSTCRWPLLVHPPGMAQFMLLDLAPVHSSIYLQSAPYQLQVTILPCLTAGCAAGRGL